MITIKTESPINNGLVRRRYEIIVNDLSGTEHSTVIGMFNHAKGYDYSHLETDFVESQKSGEQETYMSAVRAGVNPFTTTALLWNTRNEMLKVVLDSAMSLPATDPLVLNGLPFLALVSDAEIMAIYSKDQAWVDNVRIETSKLLDSKTGIEAYNPILGGE